MTVNFIGLNMALGRKLESLKDFERALKNKYGIGQGFEYKPWLRIQYVKSRGIRSLIYGDEAISTIRQARTDRNSS